MRGSATEALTIAMYDNTNELIDLQNSISNQALEILSDMRDKEAVSKDLAENH